MSTIECRRPPPHTIGPLLLATLTYEAPNATDLGYLLHKHPARLQSFHLSVGTAHVFYLEATDERCAAAVLLEVDPVGLVRNLRVGGRTFSVWGQRGRTLARCRLRNGTP